MIRLYVMRHGNTFDPGDIVRRVGARTDLPLSSSGRAQAAAAAAHFRRAGISFNRIYASPLRRARETAAAIGDDYIVSDFLCEIDYGPDDGEPEADVVARIGRDVLHRWEEENVVPPGWNVDPAALAAAWRNFFCACADIDGGTALVVTSNGVARFALAAAKNGGDFAPKLSTAAWGVIDIAGDGMAHVISWNIRATS